MDVKTTIDDTIINLFLAANKLHIDEEIVFTGTYKEYIEACDVYRTYYKVVTINTRTGNVTVYRQYDNAYNVKWMSRGC